MAYEPYGDDWMTTDGGVPEPAAVTRRSKCKTNLSNDSDIEKLTRAVTRLIEKYLREY